MLPLQPLQADPIDLNWHVKIIDPTDHQGGHRSPVQPPIVGIEDYTIYFTTPCDGCVLRIVDENGDVVYTTVVHSTQTQIALPSTLSGNYEIRLVLGSWVFTGWITL